jgi:carbonic anhydrase
MLLQGEERKTDLTPDQALAKLMEGNKRYASSHSEHPHQDARRRHDLEKDQHPFACILSCSDSRVPPEIVFDEGLGDLFVVRVAGEIVDNAVTGSIEYAVEHLGSKLVLVLGHEKCGAVQATLGGGEPGTHIQSLVEAISPAVIEARKKPGDPLANAVHANVQFVVRQLRQSGPILAEQLRSRRIRIVGAVYDLETGSVRLLPE